MKLKRWQTMGKYVAILVVMVGLISFSASIAPEKAHASSFTIDANFIGKAMHDVNVPQYEPGYIVGNDCTHWISWFLNTEYRMPPSFMKNTTDDLINQLIGDGDAKVITGDNNYDAGGFISPPDATGIFNNLDSSLLEHGGNYEYLVAYAWSPRDVPSVLADHLTIYVGNQKVISHGTTNEWDRTPQFWNAWDNFQKANPMGEIAIIALTNGSNSGISTPPSNTTGHSPVVVKNSDGRMEVFQVGADNQLYHQWEDSNGNWSGWASLGGSWPGQPAVGINDDGRLEVFIVGNQGSTGASLFHAWQTSPGSSSWTGWTALPGTWPGGTPAVTQNLNGGLEVFIRGVDSNLYHAWENTPGDSTSFSNWNPMGGAWNTDPVVANNADGTMQVFMVGESTQLYYNQEDSSGNWSGWTSLGGSWPGQPAVTLNMNSELEIFIVGNQGSSSAMLFHTWQNSPESSSWSMTSSGGWWSLPGSWPAGTPAVTENQNGQMDVFLVGGGTTLYHDYENADGSWSGPQSLGGSWPGLPAITTNLAGGLEVFLLGNSGEVYHAWENNAGDSSNYSGWKTLGIPKS